MPTYKEKNLTVNIPEKFKCPLSKSIMRDAVLASDGHNYEKDWITTHLAKNNRSPISHTELFPVCFPNIRLRDEINDFLQLNPNLIIENEVNIPVRLWTELETAIIHSDVATFNKLITCDLRLSTMSPRQAQQEGSTFSEQLLPDNNALELATKYNSLIMVNEIRKKQMLEPILSLDELCPGANINADLIQGVQCNDRVYVKNLLEKNADPNSFVGGSGNSALQEAVRLGHSEIIVLLLSMGAVIGKNYAHETAVHLAARNNDCNTLLLLKNHGADFGALTTNKRTPLHYAAQQRISQAHGVNSVA